MGYGHDGDIWSFDHVMRSLSVGDRGGKCQREDLNPTPQV